MLIRIPGEKKWWEVVLDLVRDLLILAVIITLIQALGDGLRVRGGW